jgi:predicted nuclease of predicted toxin-antitoxin system
MEKRKALYTKQKIKLYFDENFPLEIIEYLKTNKNWKKMSKIFSFYDEDNSGKSDEFHFNYCKKRKFVLVTLDGDFMDDSRFPIMKIPGIVRIVANKQDRMGILENLATLIYFLSNVPYPRYFMGDTKFQISKEGCIVRGRDASASEIKTMSISEGMTVFDVCKNFNY